MALFKKPQPYRFTPDSPVEMHFHDHDETWIVMGGKGTASMVDTDGTESEFEIEQGDIWMVEAGVEHGVLPTTDELLIFPFNGTIPMGSHQPGHYYMGKEGYMPVLCVVKVPLDEGRREQK